MCMCLGAETKKEGNEWPSNSVVVDRGGGDRKQKKKIVAHLHPVGRHVQVSSAVRTMW